MDHFKRRDWQICDTDVAVDRDVAVPLKPGGVLFWHGMTHHGSPRNRSGLRRRALQLHYRPRGVAETTTEGPDGPSSAATSAAPPADPPFRAVPLQYFRGCFRRFGEGGKGRSSGGLRRSRAGRCCRARVDGPVSGRIQAAWRARHQPFAGSAGFRRRAEPIRGRPSGLEVIYSEKHRSHAPPFEFAADGMYPYSEAPGRAEAIRLALAADSRFRFSEPEEFDPGLLAEIHDPGYLAFLDEIYPRWVEAGRPAAGVIPDSFALYRQATRPRDLLAQPGYYCFDAQTPVAAGTRDAAYTSAGCALTGARLLLRGEHSAYALCRPPGHHASRSGYGGYCYLNNAAAAASLLAGVQGGVNGHPRHRLPPRKRHPGDFLRIGGSRDRLPARRPEPGLPVLLGISRGNRRRSRVRAQPEFPPARRHRGQAVLLRRTPARPGVPGQVLPLPPRRFPGSGHLRTRPAGEFRTDA